MSFNPMAWWQAFRVPQLDAGLPPLAPPTPMPMPLIDAGFADPPPPLVNLLYTPDIAQRVYQSDLVYRGPQTGEVELMPLLQARKQRYTKTHATSGAQETPYATPAGVTQQAGDIWSAIDELAGDPNLALAMKLAVHLESAGRADAVGDNGESHGFYQIYQRAHGQNITPQQSRDPYASTRYMLPQFKAAYQKVPQAMWQTNPMQAAALTAYYAERPAKMYEQNRVQTGWQAIQRRKLSTGHYVGDGHDHSQDGAGGAPQKSANWDFIVKGGRGTVNTGGTHGGHPAVDVFAPLGTPIYAPADGYSSPGTYPLGGNATTIRGANGKWYYLAHGARPFVSGQIKKGQIIGYVGNTGNARNAPPHLHYAAASRPEYFAQRNGSGDLDPSYNYG